MKIYRFITLFLFGTLSFNAQNSERYVTNIIQKGNDISIKVNDGAYKIKYYTSFIVETTFIPKGEIFNKFSHAVVLKPTKNKLILNS